MRSSCVSRACVSRAQRWMKGVSCLKVMNEAHEGDRAFLVSLTTRMQLAAFVRGERLPLGRLYVVRKGMVVRMWRFMGAEKSWGEDQDLKQRPHSLIACVLFTNGVHALCAPQVRTSC